MWAEARLDDQRGKDGDSEERQLKETRGPRGRWRAAGSKCSARQRL